MEEEITGLKKVDNAFSFITQGFYSDYFFLSFKI